MEELGIYYINDEVAELYKNNSGIQDEGSFGFDLINIDDVILKPFEFSIINLGIVVNIPDGYRLRLIPRSSTFKKWGISQSNSTGLIDKSYSSIEDILGFPVVWNNKEAFLSMQDSLSETNEPLRTKTIEKGQRVCQIFLEKDVPLKAVPYSPHTKVRGGFGSTGS